MKKMFKWFTKDREILRTEKDNGIEPPVEFRLLMTASDLVSLAVLLLILHKVW